jgi:hypothetical protein
MLPVFLLLLALVLDTGVWFTHKRSLQNRADAGALAAGVEYLSQLKRCTNPATSGDAATAITNAAKQYGGATSATDPYNQTPVTQDRTTVVVNADPSQPLADNTAGNPCDPHADADSISPANAIWTDVIAQETDIRTLAGMFGVNLSSITARARVEMKQLTGVAHDGLPFVNETGDQVDCAWAEFVDLVDSGKTVSLKSGASNPVPLTLDANVPRHWTASVPGIDFGPTGTDDLGVVYWMGTKKGGSCNYDPTASDEHTAKSPPLDRINVYDNDTPGSNAPPLLHHLELTPVSCGGPGYLYTSSMDPNATCTVHFRAEVDSGSANSSPEKITVSSVQSPAITVDATNGAGGTGVRNYSGDLTFKPNAVNPSSPYLQAYTQVGPHQLQVSWTKTTGKVSGKDCSKSTCSGTFLAGASAGCKKSCEPETVAHSTYVADPESSSPIMSAELTNGAGVPISNSYPADLVGGLGAFTIELTNYGIDQQRTFLFRDSVKNTGNRTKAIDCGQGTPSASGLNKAVKEGCADPVQINARGDVCSTPWPKGVRDCVETVPGTKQDTAKAYMDRFSCTDENHWEAGKSPDNLSDSDRRYAYIFLTSWGRIANAKQQGEDLPIRAFLRVYVTGWDRMGGGKPGPETCAGNEPPPIAYDDGSTSGAVLWGHFVDVITLSDDVITGEDPCDTDASLITCKPELVR